MQSYFEKLNSMTEETKLDMRWHDTIRTMDIEKITSVLKASALAWVGW